MASFGIKHQNLGAYLENKVYRKSKLSKYGINKSLSPTFVFFNEKRNSKKILSIFDFENQKFAIFDLQYQIKPNT